MTEKDSCFDNIMVLCKHSLLDYAFWHTDGGNSYIEYFEEPRFVGAIEYHFEGKGIYLEMIEISEVRRQQEYRIKIIDSTKEDVDYIKCAPKDDDVAAFYEKLGFKMSDPPFYIWNR